MAGANCGQALASVRTSALSTGGDVDGSHHFLERERRTVDHSGVRELILNTPAQNQILLDTLGVINQTLTASFFDPFSLLSPNMAAMSG